MGYLCKTCAVRYYLVLPDGTIDAVMDRWKTRKVEDTLGKRCDICGSRVDLANVDRGYFDYESEEAKKYGVFCLVPSMYRKMKEKISDTEKIVNTVNTYLKDVKTLKEQVITGHVDDVLLSTPKLSQTKYTISVLKGAGITATLGELDGKPWLQLSDRYDEPFGPNSDVQLRTMWLEVQVAIPALIMDVKKAKELSADLSKAIWVADMANEDVYVGYNRILGRLNDARKGLVEWERRGDWPGGIKRFVDDYKSRVENEERLLSGYVEKFKEETQ